MEKLLKAIENFASAMDDYVYLREGGKSSESERKMRHACDVLSAAEELQMTDAEILKAADEIRARRF
jgi:hypothetical protein